MKKLNNKGASVLGTLLLIVIIVAIAAVVYIVMNWKGAGKGEGTGDETKSSVESTEEEKTEIIIKIDEQNIFVDAEQCKDVAELAEKINKIQSGGNTKKYVLDDSNAIKSTADEVKATLQSLKESVGIDIDL